MPTGHPATEKAMGGGYDMWGCVLAASSQQGLSSSRCSCCCVLLQHVAVVHVHAVVHVSGPSTTQVQPALAAPWASSMHMTVHCITIVIPHTVFPLPLVLGALLPGLIAAVQAAQSDLAAKKGAILVTGGALALENDTSTGIAVDWGATTLAVSKAAQRKLVHILHKDLAREDIYVAEVTVAATVRGTGFDKEGKSPLTAEAVADTFYDLYTKRDPVVWFVVKAE